MNQSPKLAPHEITRHTVNSLKSPTIICDYHESSEGDYETKGRTKKSKSDGEDTSN